MRKFDFRRKLKGMDLKGLKELESYHLDLMLGFMYINDKESLKHGRYVSYIQNAIKKIQQ